MVSLAESMQKQLMKREEVFEELKPLFIHLMDGKILIKVKYFKKCKSQKDQKILHKSPERAERFETKNIQIGESMQEQLKSQKHTEELICWNNNKGKQENNTENAESAFLQ